MKIKRLTGFVLAFVMVVSLFGCNIKAKNIMVDTEDTLNILYYDTGYGNVWIQKLKDVFLAKYPGSKITLEFDPSAQTKALNELKIGSSNARDLYINGNLSYQQLVYKGSTVAAGYDCVFEDLTSLYDTVIPGESVTIREKMRPDILQHCSYEGKNYMIPWAGGESGFLYNADYFSADSGNTLPRTTNELIAFCKKKFTQKINNKTLTPIVWAGMAVDYFEYAAETWVAQYEGLSNYESIENLHFPGEGYSPEVYEQEGILKSHEVVYEILNGKDINSYVGALGLTHTAANQALLQKEAIIMPCGNWVGAEISKNSDISTTDIKMMKTPIVSALGEKLKLGGANASADAHERKLIEVVDYIDGGKTTAKPAGVTDEQILAVENARNISYCIGMDHQSYIPASSNAKTLAKNFLLLMASDEGIRLFRQYAYAETPYKFTPTAQDYTNEYLKSCEDIGNKSSLIYCNRTSNLARVSKNIARYNAYPEIYFNYQEESVTPQVAYNAEIEKLKSLLR